MGPRRVIPLFVFALSYLVPILDRCHLSARSISCVNGALYSKAHQQWRSFFLSYLFFSVLGARLLNPLAYLSFSVPIPTLVYTILFIALFLSFMPPIKASRFLLICYPIFVYFTLCYHRNAYAFSFHNHTQNLLIVVILRQCRKDRKRTFFRFSLLISCSFSFFL